MHPAKRGVDLHQVPELDGTTEITRRGNDHREDDRCLAKETGEPDQVLLRLDQRQIIGQHCQKARVQMRFFHRLATVQGNRFAVFAHPHHVVAKVGFAALLLKVEPDLGSPHVMRDHASSQAVENGHPHHEAGYGVAVAAQVDRKSTRQAPQDADETHQRHQRVEQPHGETDGLRGEAVHVFGNALVRVVRIGAAITRETRQLHAVKSVAAEPALQVMRSHPFAPVHLQHLGQVKPVHGNDDGNERQVAEAADLGPEHGLVLVLQGIVKNAVPVIEQHRHVDRREIQRNDGGEQAACLPFFF